MSSTRIRVLVALLTTSAAFGAEVTYSDKFEDGVNVGDWTYGSPYGYIDPVGGNPDAYYHDPGLSSFIPHPHTNGDSIFTGDYRANGVTAVGIDLILHYVEYSAGGRPLSIGLYSMNGTPEDISDDWTAYCVGSVNIPETPGVWLSYNFDVPSQADTLPAGWGTIPHGENSPTDPDWNDVITSVDRLFFWYGDPSMFFILQRWNAGFDNARITYTVPDCPGDLDGDNEVGLADLAQLLANYGVVEGALYEDGDLDGDGDVDLADLAELLSLYGTVCE